MRYPFYLLGFVLMMAVACDGPNHHDHQQHQNESHDHGHHDHNKSNHHMNQTPFEDLVQRFDDPARDEWQKPEAVLEAMGNVDGLAIMDIGAGTGYFSFRLAEKGATVIAADVDERFQNLIEERIKEKGVENIRTRKVPYDSPALQAEEVDRVIIVDTYHHIEDRVSYFKEVKNGLKSDGQLLVLDFKKEELPVGPPVDHKFSEEEVIAEMEQAGLSFIRRDSKTLPYQYMLFFGK